LITVNTLLITYVAVCLAGMALDLVLTWINLRHLKVHGHTVPDLLKGYVDLETLARMSAYTIDTERFSTVASCAGTSVFLLVLLSGIVPELINFMEVRGLGTIVSGMLFFVILGGAHTIFFLPFSYYRTFVIEQRYGFNTSTLKIWATDNLKSVVVASVVGGALCFAVLLLIEHGGAQWWFWAWFVFFLFQLALVALYPTVIAPWFNEFIPLEDKELEAGVKDLMAKGGLSVEGVFRMDAGKRSRHSNAYFTGLGKAKRIVLFDTLLSAHNHDEIIAVLAHEIGHWKKGHVLKSLGLSGLVSLAVFYAASVCMRWPYLYEAFGFNRWIPCVGLFLFGVLWEAVHPFLTPVPNAVSRRYEREADAFAARLLGKTKELANALKGVGRDNLANLYPHPVYAWFHCSHPPLLERIRFLEEGGAD
jgi:STE24 endopeptidase